ncbi:MAG TPA: hypothetical protein VGF10_01670 [Gaiella sp.]|jgi:hypothetical protein
MPQARRLALVLTACALLTGCSSSETPPLPPGPAPPQVSELHWVERYPAQGAAVVFTAARFEVTKSGWRAEIGLENGTSTSWRLVETPTTGFGVMLFPTDDVSEVESRSSGGDLPGLREAQTFDPPLPPSLGPGESWHGTIVAPGPLAAGLYARIVFGLLAAVGDTPEGMPAEFSWITDHAYKLQDEKRG